ncbi:MAG: cobalamin-dependent protein, partial [Candidatus Bathyarchaeota archaeon]|nr:cobalamin-dependent protein [Candidatus Bathyarchaeota archaeon]
DRKYMEEKNNLLEVIRNSIINLEMDNAINAAKKALESGISPYKLIEEMRNASAAVGEKFESNEYFISELVISGSIMKSISDIIKPYMVGKDAKYKAKAVIGSAPGDLHDIGKNIAVVSLIGSGFDVTDLGIDVSAEKFVDAVKNENAQIVGISALTSSTMLGIKQVVEALESSGIRNRVKVIVGGAPLTDEFAKSAGADARAKDVVHGVKICEQWILS